LISCPRLYTIAKVLSRLFCGGRRRARVDVGEGLNKILMIVEAFVVHPDSAQATVRGRGEVLSVQYKKIPVKHAPQDEVRKLDDKKRKLVRKCNELERRKAVLEKQWRFLDSAIEFAGVEVPREIKTQFPKEADLRATVEFLGEGYQKLSDETRQLDIDIEDLQHDIKVIDRKIKQQRKSAAPVKQAIEVLFQSNEEQALDIEVSYTAGLATWKPVYKVDVPLDLSKVDLTMFATIEQKTGENWDGVKLSVSNAVPIRGAELPDLRRWELGLFTPTPYAAAGAGIRRRSASLGDVEMCAMAEEESASLDMEEIMSAAEPAAEYAQAEVRELPHMFEYELPQPIDMRSGEDETILPLYTKELEGEFFAHVVPKVNPLAFLVCKIAPDKALLAGKLNVHFGGRFVAGTALPEKSAGEDLLVNLGADRGIKAERDKTVDKVSETFFGVVDRHSTARQLEFLVRVENLKEQKTRVRLLDHVPISNIDRVQIKGVEVTPEPTEEDYRDRKGVMLWDFEVDPGETKELRMKFHVKHPKNSTPTGL